MKRCADREEGVLLIEMMFGLTILTVGLLGFFVAYTANFSATQETASNDEASAALEDIAEALRSSDFETLYSNYNYSWFEVPGLQIQGTYTYEYGGTYGTYNYSYPAYAFVYFYTNEAYLPSEFGPLVDIDGDGARNTTDCSTTYELLPALISLSYTVGTRWETKQLFLVIGDNG
jgi:Tfp pilus assembly protein PilW